jgi:pyruvate ferredoxin oxidoreductase alpha subunit
VGLLKVKLFRPFPTAAIRQHLAGAGKVAVLDRNLSPGRGGIFAEEIRAALYDVAAADRPMLFGYILGLGGRDVTPDTIRDIVQRTRLASAPPTQDLWIDLELPDVAPIAHTAPVTHTAPLAAAGRTA